MLEVMVLISKCVMFTIFFLVTVVQHYDWLILHVILCMPGELDECHKAIISMPSFLRELPLKNLTWLSGFVGTKCSDLKINHQKANIDLPLFWILGGTWMSVVVTVTLPLNQTHAHLQCVLLSWRQLNETLIVRDGLCSRSAQSIIFTAKVSSLSPALLLVRKSV